MESNDDPRSHTSIDASYRAVMSIPNFRILWMGSTLAFVAGAISQVAMPIFVYDRTKSASLMSVILVVQLIPQAILSPFAGVLADTFDRRKLMLASCAIRAAAVVFVPFATEAWHVAALSAVVGFGAVVYGPSEMATVPTIVKPAQLVTALSAVQVASAMTRVIGPALGAGLIALSGTDIAFWCQATILVLAFIVLLRMQLPVNETSQAFADTRAFGRYLWHEAVEGLRVVWRVPIVRAVCGTEALWTLSLAALSVTTVVYVKEELDLGDRGNLIFGALAVCISLGATAGALVARRIEARGKRLFLMLVGYFAPLLFVPAFFDPPLPVLFVCWFLLGFADAWLVIAMFAYVIEGVPENTRGRVFAIWHGIIALASVGTFAFVGWLTEALGAQTTYLLVGLVVSLGSPLLLWASGALESVRRPAAPHHLSPSPSTD
ncbi:MAG: MFS transporter [Thermomicrobiales bacterium]|nr:MFS transporter [Thermomicrobiales bacterium]